MPNFITPARIAAVVGVLTGLAAAATSLAQVLPASSTVTTTIVAAAGILTTGATVFKYLEGYSNWEVAQVHAQTTLQLSAVPVHVPVAAPEPVADEAPHAVLPDEEPIVDTPEPDRLAAQSSGIVTVNVNPLPPAAGV